MLKKSNQKGFTIIEVLIVLAIAGVIMLIVFLAVPALQRNSRNTQRKADISAALAGIQESLNNNNGVFQSLATSITNAKFGFYDPASEVTGSLANNAIVTSVTSTDGVVINNYSKCASNPAANTAAVTLASNGASKKGVTAVYRIETSGGYQATCVDM